MSLPRLGNAIIINNVSKSVPGSEADVKRLKEMYETVGFDVFIYRDPNAQVLSLISNSCFRLLVDLLHIRTHRHSRTLTHTIGYKRVNIKKEHTRHRWSLYRLFETMTPCSLSSIQLYYG